MRKFLSFYLNLLLLVTITPMSLATTPLHNLSYATYHNNERLTQVHTFNNVNFNTPYTYLPGVFTFRGSSLRTSPSYGITKVKDFTLSKLWHFNTHTSSWGGGAGWTGQPAIVKWPLPIQKTMNLYEPYLNDPDFVEVIYASLSGYIYFLDLKTGKPSRPSIHVGNPIKGSLSIDPRGYPLLYVGEGIPEKGSIGFNIYNLLDGSKLYHINGIDKTAARGWGAFDSSALIHAGTDTLIEAGENGLIYFIKLNTTFNLHNKSISIKPDIYKYKYAIKGARSYGIENSPVAYENFLYFADNSGFIHCINIHTLQPVWLYNAGDDTDATLTLDVEDGIPYIYTGTEVDYQGTSGICTLRKLNGLTGEVIWSNEYPCKSIIGSKAVNGGLLATSVVGKNQLSDSVIFSIARYEKMQQGLIISLDKKTGKVKWSRTLNNYMWSSPVDIYDKDGKSYLIQCDSVGNMLLINGLTGEVLSKINLGSNIEATPAFYEDYIVVAPRGNKIYGVKLN